jgi:hypothetical protein
MCRFTHVSTLGGEWVVTDTSQTHYCQGSAPLPIVQETECASGPVWRGTKNLSLTGIPSLDRPARFESLYQPLIKIFL